MYRRSISKQIRGTSMRMQHPLRAREKRVNARVLRLMSVLIFTGLCTGFYFFLHSSLFEIHRVEIQGLSTVPQEKVLEEIYASLQKKRFGIPQKKRYIFQEEKLRRQLMLSYPFEDVSMVRKKGELSISVREYVTEIAWKSADKWYLLNLSGIVVRQALPEEMSFLAMLEQGNSVAEHPVKHLQPFIPLIIDLSSLEVTPGENVLSPLSSSELILASQLLQKKQITPRYFLIERRNTPWVTAVTTMPFHIRIDGVGDVASQLSRYDLALQNIGDPNRIEYIDLRFGDHVFIRERD